MILHSYDMIFSGLALDVVGAIVLAKGFMLKNPRVMLYESLSISGRNPLVLKSALFQRAEATVGALFMVTGFGLQIWGSLHGGIAATQPGAIDNMPKAFCVVLAAGIVGWACLKTAHAWARRVFFKGMFVEPLDPLPRQPDDKMWLGRLSTLLELRRKPGESDDDFFVRLQERNHQLSLRYRKPIQSGEN